MINGSALPSPVPSPSSPTDQQLLLLIHQVQQNHLPLLNDIILGILLKFPLPNALFPTQARLNVYYFIASHSSPLNPATSHPLVLITTIVFWPMWLIIGILLLYFLIKFVMKALKSLLPTVFSRFVTPQPKTFLDLKFPSDTSKSAYATEQVYALFHALTRQQTLKERLVNGQKVFSLEIVASREEGIRYVLVIPKKNAEVVKRSILSYLPGTEIKESSDYLDQGISKESFIESVLDLKFANHFALPLLKQKTLTEHDPISYLTGNMTKLKTGELISFQLTTSPLLSSHHSDVYKKISVLRTRMYRGQPLRSELYPSVIQQLVSNPGVGVLVFLLKALGWILKVSFLFVISIPSTIADSTGQTVPILMHDSPPMPPMTEILNPYEVELRDIVKEKINQQLFETSIRVLVRSFDSEELESRISGLLATIGLLNSPYQGLITKRSFLPAKTTVNQRINQFKNRILSPQTLRNSNPILSTSEISDLYHFPYTDTTKTEDMVKVYSKELPAPLSLKRNRRLDVIFGKNNYGDSVTDIGFTEEERQTHMYILGRTGSGKTTMMFSMAKHDILEGRGLAFIDPHGDVAEDLLASVPLSRKDDLIYINPIDLKYPIGINLLELSKGLDEDETELEKEVVAEGIISLFRKVFSKDENANAHRIEYILRNTIYTAFTVEGCTLFTINKILTNPTFRKQVISKLKDEDLIDFWKYEFGKAGDYQVVKMTQGVTAKVGRFSRSPTAKRILVQSRSTINFDDIINNGKILICNFSQGKLGEDTSRLLGTTILTKLQQAALKRAYIPEKQRRSFYLYVDEFQNFATQSFTKMITEGRKYKMPLIIAEQSTSQQHDRDITNILMANVTTIVSFRSGNYVDEDLMLNQFRPYLEKGAIMNLPRYHFYIKISAIESEEPFSGETIFVPVEKNVKKINSLIQSSRQNWANEYDISNQQLEEVTVKTNDVNDIKTPTKPMIKTGLPKRR